MLSEADVKGFQKLLLAHLTRLDSARAQLREDAMQGSGGEASGGLSHVPTHLADMGNFEADEEITLGMLKNEEHLIEEIENALDRIEQGQYGTCQGCQKKIKLERLKAVPYARHCVECARAEERS